MNRAAVLRGLVTAGVAAALAVATIVVFDGSTAAGDGGSAPAAGPPSTAGATTTTLTPPTTADPTTSTSAPAPTTTTSPPTTRPPAPPSTTVPPARPEPPADDGDADVRRLQERLADLGYDVGPVDGVAGSRTTFALLAFQRVEGLARDGKAGPAVMAALDRATPPRALFPGGAPTRIEVDLARQVLLYWEDGALARILPVSTGSGRYYCNPDGPCETAVTPTGTYRIGRRYAGTEIAPLGALHYPMYFNRGIAIHGSPSVPAHPDSHGCVRIPMYAAAGFYDQVATGTPVHVVDGGQGAAAAATTSAATDTADGGLPPEQSPEPGKV